MTRTRLLLATLLALLLTSGLALAPTAAGAHTDTANLAPEGEPEVTPLGAHVEVSARYTNDDELVEAATMAVAGTGPGGATVAATPMTAVPDTVGLYQADLTFPAPGAWTLTVTATEPEGTTQLQVEVPGEPSTTTTAAPTTTTTETAAEEARDEESGSSALPWVLVGLVVLAVAAVVVLVVRRRGADAAGVPASRR
jgi:hypothetical protein